jgi:site-specific recombinase XerD
MVLIIRKSDLPEVPDVHENLSKIAELAHIVKLREPRPAGFAMLFTNDLKLIEPAVVFLHEHCVQRAHTADTVRSYTEILYDWFETLEQNGIDWKEADAVDLTAYRNRMMQQPSDHTGLPYRISTINHRVRGVLRFYKWALKMRWLNFSQLADAPGGFNAARQIRPSRSTSVQSADNSLFVLRQYEQLPRPLSSIQVRELLSKLNPPHDLMARWQIYTGLRVSELLRLEVKSISQVLSSAGIHRSIDVIRKGQKSGYVIASVSLLEETERYITTYRHAWLQRALKKGKKADHTALFINSRGNPVGKNYYQRMISEAGHACGFKATTHLLRATFACMLLARLQRQANEGADINPLMVVKILMGHERIETTDRYLRAIDVNIVAIKEVLETMLSDES